MDLTKVMLINGDNYISIKKFQKLSTMILFQFSFFSSFT